MCKRAFITETEKQDRDLQIDFFKKLSYVNVRRLGYFQWQLLEENLGVRPRVIVLQRKRKLSKAKEHLVLTQYSDSNV